MGVVNSQKQNYNTLDIVKFILAVFLVIAHAAAEKIQMPTIIDKLCSFYIIVVPFFFTTSSFLFFNKLIRCVSETEKKQRYLKYTKRILILYLVWTIIYAIFNICDWCISGTTFIDIITYIWRCITYSSYSTIWFLPALWIGVSLVYLLHMKGVSTKNIIVIGISSYIIGWFCYTFSGSLTWLGNFSEIFKTIFTSYRNGFMYAMVYAALGLALANIRDDETQYNLRKNIILSALLCIAFVVEAFITNKLLNVDANYLMMLIPFSYFFVKSVLQINLPDKYHNIYVWLRNMSLLIFLSQRIFLTAIPNLLPANILSLIFGDWIIGLFIILFSTIIFSFFIIKLSPRFTILYKLWQ